jgi:Carboxypeptidase regulatory-like domain
VVSKSTGPLCARSAPQRHWQPAKGSAGISTGGASWLVPSESLESSACPEVVMRRILVALVTVLSALYCAPFLVHTQAGTQVGRTGTTTGAQAPGMPPPRDNRGAAQSGTARLRGRVVAAQTGLPLRCAQVTVFSADGQLQRSATTDDEGRYEFVELPAGRLSVTATKAGYVPQQYGQRRPFEAGRPVTFADARASRALTSRCRAGPDL